MNLPFFAVKAYVPGGVQNQAEKKIEKCLPTGTGTKIYFFSLFLTFSLSLPLSRRRWNGHFFFSIKLLLLSKIPKHVESKALKHWQGFRSLHKMLWTDSFLCILSHVFFWLKRMCLHTCLWTAIPETDIETCA